MRKYRRDRIGRFAGTLAKAANLEVDLNFGRVNVKANSRAKAASASYQRTYKIRRLQVQTKAGVFAKVRN